MTTVSFIIPSYNCRKTLEGTVTSILEQTGPEHIKDIIIVDSSDDKETKAYLLSIKHPLVKTVLLHQRTSPAEGRNLGAKQATGGLLCFIDSDVYLAQDWLKKILDAHADGALVGCGSVSAPEFQANNVLALAQLYLQFNESLNRGDRRKVQMVPACNMFCERELFERTGGFPQIRASEDVLFCLKVGEVTDVCFVPAAKCFHVFRTKFDAYFRNQIILGKYIIIYRREHYKKWYYRGPVPLFLLPAFLTIKFLRITGRILKAGAGHFGKFLISFPLFLAGLFYWAVGFAQGCFEIKD